MRRACLTFLAVLGIIAALTATAYSTAEQATAALMPPLAVAGLVTLLECVNVAGSWTWLTDAREHVRWEAAGGVAVASLITGACAFASFGWLGLAAPAGLLYTVHLTFRLNQPGTAPGGKEEPSASRPTPRTVEASTPVDRDVVSVPVSSDRATVNDPVLPASSPVPDTADTGPVTAPPTAPLPQPERLAEVYARTVGRAPGSVEPDAPEGFQVPERPATPGPSDEAASPAPNLPAPPEVEADRPVYTPQVPVEQRARELIDEADTAGKRLSEGKLHSALVAEGYEIKRYRCKKLLGYKTHEPRRRLEAVR